MSYFGQIHYEQRLGNSGLTLAEAGCYVTAFSNLLDKVGVNIDPPTLNDFFLNHGVFLYDKQDHAYDDLYWGAVSKYCLQMVVSQTGGASWPTSDLAVVEFYYKSHTGAMVTHFCAVNNVADHSIIDSWDGLVKTPAQYEGLYGNPVAWATYVYHTPVTTPAETAPAVPVSVPTAAASVPQPPAPASAKQLVLPQLNNGHYYGPWHVYKPGGPYTLPYAIGALNVFKYGPLTYDILGNPAPNIYLIKTQSFGEVAIYAGPDTIAQFPEGHGEGESLPVAEVVPAPTAAPEEPTQPAVTYVRFKDEAGNPEPMSLVTKEGAQKVDFLTGQVAENLAAGTPFKAVGKATLANNDTYYMNDNDFGIADETQRTQLPHGIKTSYLELAPAPAAEPAPTVNVVESPGTVHFQVHDSTEPDVADKAEPATQDAELPWQRYYRGFMNPVTYVAKEDTTLYEFPSGNVVKEVKQGAHGEIAGRFPFAGALYYRTKASADDGTWKGYPVTALERQNPRNTPMNTPEDSDITELGDQAQAISKTKHLSIKAGATAQGLLSRLRKK